MKEKTKKFFVSKILYIQYVILEMTMLVTVIKQVDAHCYRYHCECHRLKFKLIDFIVLLLQKPEKQYHCDVILRNGELSLVKFLTKQSTTFPQFTQWLHYQKKICATKAIQKQQ